MTIRHPLTLALSLFMLTACSGSDTDTDLCGNGILDAGEQCDGTLFADGLSCQSLVGSDGDLSCLDSCHFTVVDCGAAAAPASVQAGGACNCSSDCVGTDTNPGVCLFGVCMTMADGACAEAGTTQGCPTGSRCWGMDGVDGSLCWPDCASFTCAGECDSDGSCVPNDATSCDGTCSEYCGGSSGGGGGGSSSGPCTPDNPTGDCPAGQVCEDGICQDFDCTDTQFEPNETLQSAAAMPAGTTTNLQICSGDSDWYLLSPTTTNTLYMVNVDSNPSSGNLELRITDGSGISESDGHIESDFYHSENALGPMNIEGHSIVGSSTAEPAFFEVSGKSGAVNNYTLITREIDYQDGPNCSVNFDTSDCLSQTNGYHDSSKMMVFPVGHTQDTYIGDGVYFENALQMMSGMGLASYTSSSRLWARRELVMAVRHAIHSVQEAFPGTAPLGMGDISMPDGTTPEGHPNGTHYYGANADIAYYIDSNYHTQHGNLTYRHICCESALSDWSCVDTNTSSAGYGTCVTGSEDTHIVDIPRTAMFMAKLAGTGRVRVIGVEAKIDAALDAGLDELVDQGHITSSERSAAHNVIVTANDHGSWIWHFNHMHVSFKTDGAKSRTSSYQGPWPHLDETEQLERVQSYYRSDVFKHIH